MHSDLVLEPVDVADAAGFAEFHHVLTEAETAGREFPTPTGLEEMRVGFSPANADWRATAVVARSRGQVVGAMNLEQPLRDNTHLLEAQIGVLPQHRRGGVGRALFGRAVEIARDAGRRSIWAEVASPVGAPAAGAAFAEANGMSRKHTELHQVLKLPVPDTMLVELAESAGLTKAGGYRLVTWQDRCPDEWVEGYCALLTVFLDHVPLGELDVEPQFWDEDRLRTTEARRQAQGRTTYRAIAVDAGGDVVGCTDVLVPAPPSLEVHQGGTLVLTEHRGHRLGTALKLATLRRLSREQPERRTMHTYNAAENGPMIAVNDAMGYRSVEENSEWQYEV